MGKLIDENGLRMDGRGLEHLRPVKIEVGLLENANGSVYLEQGKCRILAAVYGPHEAHPRHLALPDRAILRCRYHMAPFSVTERKNPAPSRREIELSKVIREALEPGHPPAPLSPCPRCGEPSAEGLCEACRLVERLG